ncbi:MAG: DUF3795 domain-containing protein [Candidatus Bathyarchaeia archaeon]
MSDPTGLVGYCGLYCGACGIYQGAIKQRVEQLRGIIKRYGFDKIVPELAKWEPAFKHYKEFESVLDGLVKLFGSCPGCLGGGGDPNCKVRQCAKQKGYTTCAECNEASTCERLQPFLKKYSGHKETLERIREIGVASWAEEMNEKVKSGFSYLEQ